MRLATTFLLFAACAPKDDAPAPEPCPAGGAVRTITSELTGGSEGVVFGDDGTLYVGNDDRVVTVTADGVITELAQIPSVVGLAWWNDAVWAASWENAEGDDEPSLWEIKPDGTATRTRISDPPKPNFLLPTPWGSLLVSDDFETSIWEFTGNGVTTEWATGMPSPNGMGFSPDGTQLYVANTFVNPAPLQVLPVTDGVAGDPETLHEWGTGTTPDGLVVSGDGTVLVALNLAGLVVAWDGTGVETVASGVNTVASLAFGRGEFDRCSVVATSLFGTKLYEVAVGRAE
jgi:sugar lactone lactonase YvrE